MKKLFVIPVFFMACFLSLHAQDKYDDLIKVGDELTIAAPSASSYQFIKIPNKNFIIKRGGIANMSSIKNNRVNITKISKDKKDRTIVTLKRTNGTKFFNAYRTLKADLNGAITNGELKFKDSSKKSDLAR